MIILYNLKDHIYICDHIYIYYHLGQFANVWRLLGVPQKGITGGVLATLIISFKQISLDFFVS